MSEQPGYDSSNTWIRGGEAPHPSTSEALPALDGFAVEKKLAEGGMGSVFLATDLKTQRKVALKLIHPHFASNQDFVQRFINEAKATTALRHEHIVETTGHGIDRDRYFMACEFVDGGTVQDLTAAMGSLPAPLALELLAQLLEALAYAHSQGVIHRDIKPANLLLTRTGCLKVSDFGIAKMAGGAKLTQTGVLIGTPAYMSPEQAKGEPVDARSDLYSAGVVLYEFLGGSNPRASDNPTTALAKILNEELSPISEVVPGIPVSVQEVLDNLTSRDPLSRFPSAEAVLSKIQPAVDEIRRNRPGLVAECLADPVEMRNRLFREQAAAWHQRAKEFLQQRPTRKEPAALCAYYAASLDPRNEYFERFFTQLCASHGNHFGPSQNPKVIELEKLLQNNPQSPGVLQQLAQLYRLEGNIYRASTSLRRYLGVRPKDGYASTLLSQLTGEQVSAPVPMGPDTRKLGEGIRTGGLKALAKQNLREGAAQAVAPPRTTSASPGPARAPTLPPGKFVIHAPQSTGMPLSQLWNAVGKKALILAAIFGLGAFAIKRAGRFVDSSVRDSTQASDTLARAKDQEESARLAAQSERTLERMSDANAKEAARLLDSATASLNRNDFAGSVKEFDHLIQQFPKRSEAVTAKFLRAKALLALGKVPEATAAFSEFLDRHASSANYWEALLRRGQAYHRMLDDKSALGDLNHLLGQQPTNPLAPEALLTRGEIHAAQGSKDDAAADFRAVLAQTGPSNPLNAKASNDLQELAGRSP